MAETMRNASQWMGATAQSFGSYPAMSILPNPAMDWFKAWGEVTERTFSRMIVKPDWNMPTISLEDGKDHVVEIVPVVERAFGDLIHFQVTDRPAKPRKVLLVAPSKTVNDNSPLIDSTVVGSHARSI